MSKQKKDSEVTICLPGPEAWELWRSDGGAPFVLADSAPIIEGGSPASFKGATIYGIPVAGGFSVPLWVSTEDPELVEGVLEMQLETLGLQTDAFEGQHRHYAVVDRAEKRTLLAVTVISDRYGFELPKEIPGQYEFSPELYVLPENQLTLWEEMGKVVFAVTRRDHVIYFQSLSSGHLDMDGARDLQSIVMLLQSQGVVDRLDGVTIWMDTERVPDTVANSLSALVDAPAFREPRPVPSRPLEGSDLLPAQVAEFRRQAARKDRIKNIALVACAAYIAMAAVFAGSYFWKAHQLSKVKSEVAELEKVVGWVPGIRSTWLELERTVDVDNYPVETFLRLYDLLPEKGVRFNTFNVSTSIVTIEGEAQDQRAAIRFKNAVENNPKLDRFKWDGPPPRIGRNRTATFNLTGRIQDGSAES